MAYLESGQAGGNIKPHRFCRPTTAGSTSANDGIYVQSSTGEKCYGVSREGSRYLPGFGNLDDGYIAISGENIALYTENAICLLKLGGTVNAGEYLKSDSDGAGVATTAENDEIGAIALEYGVSGGLAKVRVVTQRNV